MPKTVFVTGATGLLGNNLVHLLLDRGYTVKALFRSPQKAHKQFEANDRLELVQGDMADIKSFCCALEGCETLFHTAAFFRDNYKGGSHWDELEKINIKGTNALLESAYIAGIRNFVHVSSIAVLDGTPGQLIDETCDRNIADADEYYKSKIDSEKVVRTFAKSHPDINCYYILPGWMWGPGDIGPTSAGQLALDVLNKKLPALVPGTFSVVDARDVAQAMIEVTTKGENGSRYLVAGRHITMKDLVQLIGKTACVATPTKTLPIPLLYLVALFQEFYHKISRKPILLSLSSVKLMVSQYNRTHFSRSKFQKELGLNFRSLDETIKDTIHSLKSNFSI